MKINRQKEDERRDSDADIMELLQMKSDDVSKTRVLNEKQRSDVRQLGQSEIMLILNQKKHHISGKGNLRDEVVIVPEGKRPRKRKLKPNSEVTVTAVKSEIINN